MSSPPTMWNSLRQSVARRLRLGQHLLQRVAVRALFLRAAARTPQNTHVFRRMQTFVGLMCWLAANVTTVAVLRAVHRVGQRADAEEVGRVEERDAVGRRRAARPPRPCRRSGSSAGSRDRALSGSNGRQIGHGSLLEALDGERHVVAAEPEAVAERDVDLALRWPRSACSSRSHSGIRRSRS